MATDSVGQLVDYSARIVLKIYGGTSNEFLEHFTELQISRITIVWELLGVEERIEVREIKSFKSE